MSFSCTINEFKASVERPLIRSDETGKCGSLKGRGICVLNLLIITPWKYVKETVIRLLDLVEAIARFVKALFLAMFGQESWSNVGKSAAKILDVAFAQVAMTWKHLSHCVLFIVGSTVHPGAAIRYKKPLIQPPEKEITPPPESSAEAEARVIREGSINGSLQDGSPLSTGSSSTETLGRSALGTSAFGTSDFVVVPSQSIRGMP